MLIVKSIVASGSGMPILGLAATDRLDDKAAVAGLIAVAGNALVVPTGRRLVNRRNPPSRATDEGWRGWP